MTDARYAAALDVFYELADIAADGPLGRKPMQLTDLDPNWVGAGGEGVSNQDGSPVPERTGVGISFDCPCGCDSRCFVGFSNPIDGGPAYDPRERAQWQRTGDTFETLTLTPSIQRRKVGEHGCTWHGFITNGEIVTA